MPKATIDNSTPASRRRFLAFAGAASAITAGSLAAAAMPPTALQACSLSDDSPLVKLEKQILQHRDAIAAMEPEVERLEAIWHKVNHRMHDEFEATRTGPAFDERKSIVDAMPEFQEYMRLRHLQAIEREAADSLVSQMWAIPAHTSEGKRAKVSVLLGFVMDDDEWRRPKDPDDVWDAIQMRDLLIDLVGGAPAEQLRGQFA